MILTRVSIAKLWGTKDIAFDLHPDVNYLIGSNGTGKTTVVTLVAAVLKADVQTLEKFAFNSVTLYLADYKNKRGRKMTLTATVNSERSIIGSRISLELREGKNLVAQANNGSLLTGRGLFTRSLFDTGSDSAAELRTHIRALLRVSWLDLTRSSGRNPIDSKREQVDQKLIDLNGSLVRHFSEIDSAVRIEREQFQKEVFLKLIERKTEPQLMTWLKGIDLEAEKKAIGEILTAFFSNSSKWRNAFDSHFETLRGLPAKNVNAFTFTQLEALIAMQHLHAVVQDWHALSKKQAKITANRELFLEMLCDLMSQKHFSINEKNELEVSLKPEGTGLALTQLSSGEKQLLILLGEALLQRGKRHLYVADEPELSLHVSWQEKITAMLRGLNPNAQILFATHSPEILGEYGDRSIDMEKLEDASRSH